MKNVILLHGTWWNPENFWFPYIRNTLDKRKFTLQIPQLPHPENPRISEWLNFTQENLIYDANTILVAHSAGCPLLLSILESLQGVKINRAILVSGFCEPLGNPPEQILQEIYDWGEIKNSCGHFIFINSYNDPWGCNEKQWEKMQQKLWGELILRNEWHMWSGVFNQPYKNFPLLKALIEME